MDEKVHDYAHKNSPLGPTPSHMSAVCTMTYYFFQTHFNIILSSTLSCPKQSLPYRFTD
jgi:hypothetical protein